MFVQSCPKVVPLFSTLTQVDRELFSEDGNPGVAAKNPEIKKRAQPAMIEPQRPKIPITGIERDKKAGHKAGGQHQPPIGEMNHGKQNHPNGNGQQQAMMRKDFHEIIDTQGLHKKLLEDSPQRIQEQQKQHVALPEHSTGHYGIPGHG